MGLSGLVFGVVAVVWLLYLIPLFLNRRDNGLLEEVEPGEPFSASVTIVRKATPLESAEEGTAVVSTPLNRRAALRELAALDRDAARRRRRVLGFLALVGVTVLGAAVLGHVPWWAVGVPVGAIVLFLVVARFSVRALRRGLDARARVVRGGDSVDEPTIAIALLDGPVEDADDAEHSVELSVPIQTPGSLWDPIPVPAPTYVSRPLAPRTVRTIDLSAPLPAPSAVPVTADRPVGADADAAAGGADEVAGRRPAVGE